KQFSAIKGGRLAMRAAPARVVSLIVSDVPGDNPAFVASGPTIPSATTGRDVRELIDRYKLNLPGNILAFLEKSELEPPSPDDTVFAGNETRIIASARQSLEAAADYGRRQNMDVRILSDAMEGESRIVGRQLAEQACQLAVSKVGDRPLLLLSGGETTVTLDAAGKGGPNTEYMLSFALHLESSQEIISLAADTDGIDGSEDNAGAFADQTTRDRMLTAGIDAADCLQRHDSWTAFDRIGDLFVTGPTGTNVNDFRAILIK
ncbi:MAG: glycerate kinase type-2 family protein, partial [Rhizobiaceae bacterium]